MEDSHRISRGQYSYWSTFLDTSAAPYPASSVGQVPYQRGTPDSEGLASEFAPPENDPEWAGLLGYLLNARGFDFHGYKPTSLARRIPKRMDAVGIESFAAYEDYLEVHPNESEILFNVILINVTGFFRDPAAWESVRTTALPQILGAKTPDEPIRAWSAGCASGEEAYTIAMMLAEELGPDQFRERVKIYATDVDEDALNARQAAYPERHVEGTPPELLSKYFDHVDGLYILRKDIRRQVIFGRHDLINDAPISRIDLLACRNTLMYLNAEIQARVLARLHFALNDGGFLLLGRAETLMAHGGSFTPVDLKRRLPRKSLRGPLRDQFISREGVPETTIGVSGYTEQAVAPQVNGSGPGVTTFLQKPFLAEDLIGVLRPIVEVAI